MSSKEVKGCSTCYYKINYKYVDRKKLPCKKCKNYSRWK